MNKVRQTSVPVDTTYEYSLRILLFIGTIIPFLTQGKLTEAIGKEFVFTTVFCNPHDPPSLVVWTQTRLPINVTITHERKRSTHLLGGGSLVRLKLRCPFRRWAGRREARGYRVTATADVAIYVDYNDDNYLVFPVDALGEKYFLPRIPTSLGVSFYTLVAVANNTKVTVTAPPWRSGIPNMSMAGTNGTEILDGNQVFTVECQCDLAGTLIEADSGVLVLTGSRHTNFTADKAVMVDSVLPRDNWGREFFVYSPIWAHLNLSITGVHDKTEVTWKSATDGVSFTLVSGARSTKSVTPGQIVLVRTDNPVYLLGEYRTQGATPGPSRTLLTVLPVEQYRSWTDPPTDFPNASFTHLLKSYQMCNHSLLNATSLLRENNVIYSVIQDLNDSLNLSGVLADIPVHGFLLSSSYGTVRLYPLAGQLIDLETCSGQGYRGNGRDDDCDGATDEEIYNGKDDDRDGFIDEDFAIGGCESIANTESDGAKSSRQGRSYYDMLMYGSVVAVIVSLSIALWAVAFVIGGSLVMEHVRRHGAMRSVRVSPVEGW